MLIISSKKPNFNHINSISRCFKESVDKSKMIYTSQRECATGTFVHKVYSTRQ